MRIPTSKTFMAGFVLTLATAVAGHATAQEVGTVTGLVLDARSQAPVSAVQVHIPALQVGSLTQANGRFTLSNVPPGTHEVHVDRIGYRSESREVTVAAGETVDTSFDLVQDALALDQLVVTGTAGQARRREVGNVISEVRMDDVREPVAGLGELLQGRVAGARITQGSGNSGGGVDIRLRGNVSVAMSNQPLIYIDGVRAKSEPYPNTDGSDPPSPLSDINPEDIDRIEIVKGPAATTLYGTEAAAGVIQIFTKRGGSGGAAQWTVESRHGFSYLRPFSGTDEVPYFNIDPVMRNGFRQGYSLSVRGGEADGLGYYISASIEDNQGPILSDDQQNIGLRANMQFRPAEDWLVSMTNSFSNSEFNNVAGGNTIEGIVMTGMRGDRSYLGTRSPEAMRLLTEPTRRTEITRYVSGMTVNYTPTPSFTHRLTVGYDFSLFERERVMPYDWRGPVGIAGDLGSIDRGQNRTDLWSVDYVSSLGFDVTDNLRSTLSWGLQGSHHREERITAGGEEFPGPGDYTINSTAVRTGNQFLITQITGGFFVQDMLALHDRYFLTVGLRVDGNSAFGSGFGLQPYPKVSSSYIISDETFWPQRLGDVKLRAAYGLAGRAPGAFDAVRTWDPQSWGPTLAAFVPGNLGNPQLGPEKTSELEVGVDGSFLSDRLGLEFTYFSRMTSDALFAVNNPAVEGGWSSQLENVGEIKTSGIELGLNATVLETPALSWDIGATVSTNNSEVVSLGGAPEFSVGNRAWVLEGQPVPVFRGYKLMNYWEKADPIIEPEQIIGPGYPPHILNFSTSLTLPRGITLSSRAEYHGTSYIWHIPEAAVLDRSLPFAGCYDAYRKVDPSWEVGPVGAENTIPQDPSGVDDLYAWERAKCFGLMSPARYDLVVMPMRYFQIRDVTASLPISNLVPNLLAWSNRTDLTVSVRNPWHWQNEELNGHPEQLERTGTGMTSGFGETHQLVRRLGEQIPPASIVTFSLRVLF